MSDRLQRKGIFAAILLMVAGVFFVFFPFNVLNGLTLGPFTITIPSYAELGTFVLGITSPFLTGAAFILLYLTYSDQKDQLKESRDLLRQQNHNMQKQKFETTFFNLMNLSYSVAETIEDTDINGARILGRQCFHSFYGRFEELIKDQVANGEPREKIDFGQTFHEMYQSSLQPFESFFNCFFKALEFVTNSDIQDKSFYAELLSAFLTQVEQRVLFLYSLQLNEGDTKKSLLSQYGILDRTSLEGLM